MENSTVQRLNELAASDEALEFVNVFLKASNPEDQVEDEEDEDDDYEDHPADELNEKCWSDNYYLEKNGVKPKSGVLVRSAVEIGGGEGEGEYVERVYEFSDVTGNKPKVIAYIRTTGWYASYEGTTWGDDWDFVFPRDVTVVKYFKRNEQ